MTDHTSHYRHDMRVVGGYEKTLMRRALLTSQTRHHWTGGRLLLHLRVRIGAIYHLSLGVACMISAVGLSPSSDFTGDTPNRHN